MDYIVDTDLSRLVLFVILKNSCKENLNFKQINLKLKSKIAKEIFNDLIENKKSEHLILEHERIKYLSGIDY